MADVMFELPDWAVAGFAAGVINDHLRDDGDPNNDGCCPDCCAPCGALRWLRDNRRDELDDAVVTHLGLGWDWLNGGCIDWDSLAGRWGCQSKPACDEQDIADADAAMADPAPNVPMDEVLARYADEAERACPCGCGRPVEGRQVFAEGCYAVALDGPCVGEFVPGYVYRGPKDMDRVSTTFVAFDSTRHDYRWRNGGFRHVGPSATPSVCGKKLPPGHGWCFEPYGHGPPHLDCGGHGFGDEECDIREPGTETASFTVDLGRPS